MKQTRDEKFCRPCNSDSNSKSNLTFTNVPNLNSLFFFVKKNAFLNFLKTLKKRQISDEHIIRFFRLHRGLIR